MESVKRILIVGSLNSIHMYNYILNVVSQLKVSVTVYNTSSNTTIRSDYLELYNKLGITILGGYSIKDVGRLKFV